MCELFGVCANKAVNINFTWKRFYKRGKNQKDGWGICFYEKKSAKVLKEPKSTLKSELAKHFRDNNNNIISNIFISHVRYATQGKNLFENTHPFVKELNGREWVFAHNGTLRDYKRKQLGSYLPEGSTDSEYAFCYLLEKIKKGQDTWKTIIEVSNELSELGSFNYLLSDGEKLYAHAFGKDLYYLQRKPPYDDIIAKVMDEDFKLLLGDKKSRNEKAVLIATNPLTNDENWISFKKGKVYEFENGELYRTS
ncbi:class II glutamine amidotransferase [Methanocella conradii]|uniref:class II glutamine amidotransferase n=1 Tax=Methanocella conradii TaxID=1175444 RepID=UPI0024B3AB70|nr:class II glutamine amidotransferase [Methanocella conradii]MDI6896824.1 class II glutamine amidotransferase [Methanocella conradii]